ncbi:MAG: hypothetical protein CO189_00070 [candidate division Zixibacteria bacterium CG_4_9_14_3_um_filter_46_8]|nr:MAG: hypothetical protein CO189_00070 [candidate division Zixibacteria bacterium CG_4_9_14_3_um_filter_46_8]
MVGSGNFQEPIRFFGKGILLTSRCGPESTKIGDVRIQDGEDSTTIPKGFYVQPEEQIVPVMSFGVQNPLIVGNIISGNMTYDNSGAIYAQNGTVIRSSIISDNTCYCSDADGITILGSCLVIDNVISGNKSIQCDSPWAWGGGI